MRRLALISIAILIAAPVFAQVRISTDETEELAQEVETVTHEQFAQMVLKLMAGDSENVPEPSVCYSILLNMGLIPSDWVAGEELTHAELSEFLEKMGATAIYVLHEQKPPEPDEPASRDYTEAMLRRALGEIPEYTYWLRDGPGPDPRPVSPFRFQ